jgi:aspartyl-tRNA synthetase
MLSRRGTAIFQIAPVLPDEISADRQASSPRSTEMSFIDENDIMAFRRALSAVFKSADEGPDAFLRMPWRSQDRFRLG